MGVGWWTRGRPGHAGLKSRFLTSDRHRPVANAPASGGLWEQGLAYGRGFSKQLVVRLGD